MIVCWVEDSSVLQTMFVALVIAVCTMSMTMAQSPSLPLLANQHAALMDVYEELGSYFFHRNETLDTFAPFQDATIRHALDFSLLHLVLLVLFLFPQD